MAAPAQTTTPAMSGVSCLLTGLATTAILLLRRYSASLTARADDRTSVAAA
ncbi:hypothetical protein [Streptomyces sp. NPDC056304]|uniref:hypothetical protein n=1 Tax=Streptomyces sp. NPDC056304 TaxID=3345778 RepID=UPI0035DAE406